MTVQIPSSLLPLDGRFGSGPAKIRDAQLDALLGAKRTIIGTSHRQAPVKDLVGQIRSQLRQLFDAPADYEIVLGNGGSTIFWDTVAHSLIDRRAQCLDFGVFGARLARAASAPWLLPPSVRKADWGQLAVPEKQNDVDVYAWPQNETSTGVVAPVRRLVPAEQALVVIDATSSAGAIPFDARNVDAYYFALQKNFGSEGGLWVALLSPAAIERAERLHRSKRYIPESLDLKIAADNSRKNQTLNTPALTTLLLAASQLEWMLANGGMAWAAERARTTSGVIYDWADAHNLARPFVTRPELRSPTNPTIEFDARVDTKALTRLLRDHGIVDIDPYNGVGANQLRIGTYVSVDPDDAERLVASIDHLLPNVTARDGK